MGAGRMRGLSVQNATQGCRCGGNQNPTDGVPTPIGAEGLTQRALTMNQWALKTQEAHLPVGDSQKP